MSTATGRNWWPPCTCPGWSAGPCGSSTDGARAAAEFNLKGKYLATDEGLPPAKGQTYKLRVGAFFEVADGKITRVSTHYSLPEWTRQVVGKK